MQRLPQTSRDFKRLMDQTIKAHGADAVDGIDEEHLALLAAGQVDQVPKAARGVLLEQIAMHPWASELLADMQSDDAPMRMPQPVSAPRSISPFMICTFVTWGSAACLTLGVGIWRVVDPPSRVSQQINPQLNGLSVDENHDNPSGPGQYWNERDRERERQLHTGAPAPSNNMRDLALVICACSVFVLSIPVAYWLVKSMRRR